MQSRVDAYTGCHIYSGSGIIMAPDGRLLPCNHFCDNPLGELGKDFENAAEYLQFRKKSEIIDFYKMLASYPHEKCQSCGYWQECGAGCRINWLYQGADQLIKI